MDERWNRKPQKFFSIVLLFFNCLFFHFKGFICPESTNPNYKVINQTCYYFVSTKYTFADAQSNCKRKFGSFEGMLAEPKTSESVFALWSNAESIHYALSYWIGMDDLQKRDGQFRYSSSGVKVTNISGVSLYLNNSPANHNCAKLTSFFRPFIEDDTCSWRYLSICEASLTTSTNGNVFFT